METHMGIVNIDEDLHDQLRRASRVSCRSINAQAAYWIRIGLLCETNPTLSFAEIAARELREAGVSAGVSAGATTGAPRDEAA
jgi:plasmid stability protein